MYTKEEARKLIQERTESFERNLNSIKTSRDYKEAQIEEEFIKPLFKYLNWNTHSIGINNSSEREFIVQAKGQKGKEPDYLLQLDNKPRFYIEAKHSKYYLGGKTEDKGKIKERTDYIWQAYQYSYSTQDSPEREKVDFALLTDFEEFRFFDCTFAVKNPEIINNYCVVDWTYKDYIENFDNLWDLFERENVKNGSLEKLYINEKKIKENRIPPNKAFLKDLDDEKNGWRIKLAKDIKKYQPDVSSEFITQSVQLMLDRFIFIKVLADREIEEDYIQTIVNKIQEIPDKEEGVVYDECIEIFDQLDKTYNGNIFKKRSELDSVKVSNKTLLEILKDFLPNNSRYNFKKIPIEILGTIYEQFLGKVVVTTDKRATIDYKPEVRKAGGVYYTPDYIVNYIVEKTVGTKLKDCRKFEDLLEIKICDPACGSGSFLLSAYDALIKWTMHYYKSKIKVENNLSELKGLSKEERKLVYLDSDGEVRLTSKIKRDILKSCIYGVDIDAQAVEVTMMSLSLKALENTNHYEVHNERTLFHTTILPSLDNNIQCGNSLVDNSIKKQFPELPFKEIREMNSFDWEVEFKEIFENKGFDCVIGNPPYLRIQGLQEHHNEQIDFYLKNYISAVKRFDFYLLFMERGFGLLNEKGLLGFICPHKFINSDFGSGLRKFLIENTALKRIISFGNNLIFENATTYTGIFILEKFKHTDFEYYEFKDTKIANIKEYLFSQDSDYSKYSFKTLTESPWSFSDDKTSRILSKINQLKIKLGDVFEEISVGVQTGIDDVHLLKYISQKGNLITVFSEKENSNLEIEAELLKPFLLGEDVHRYKKSKFSYYCIYPYQLVDGKTKIIEEKEFAKLFPKGFEYVSRHKKYLKDIRTRQKTNPKYWYSCHRQKDMNIFEQKRIITPEISLGCNMTLCDAGIYHNTMVYSLISKKNHRENMLYWLGILNSKIMWWFLSNTGNVLRGGYFRFKTNYLSPFPIPVIDFSKKDEIQIHDRIVKLVSECLDLYNEVNMNKTQSEKDKIARYIKDYELEIDEIVFKLYDLTSEEIEIIKEVLK